VAARLTGWRVDIKSETQLADEEAYAGEEWAQGEWVVDPESGEQVWVPAEGGPALSAEEWAHSGDEDEDGVKPEATESTDAAEEPEATDEPAADEPAAEEPAAEEAPTEVADEAVAPEAE
jgi:N utilization substance protein A